MQETLNPSGQSCVGFFAGFLRGYEWYPAQLFTLPSGVLQGVGSPSEFLKQLAALSKQMQFWTYSG